MKYRMVLLLFAATALLACSLGINPAPTPTVAVPPTPRQGGTTIPVDSALPDIRFGQTGTACSPLAADLRQQAIKGTLTIFPNAGPNQLRAVVSNAGYTGNAALLNGNCQPNGQSYALAATFGLDYSATLGSVGGTRCVAQSRLVVTSFDLRGLPGPLSGLVQPAILPQIPQLVTPFIDELVARELNGGQAPGAGGRCPGS